jgi:hypothetical protein
MSPEDRSRLIKRYEEGYQEVLDSLKGLPKDALGTHPFPGKWSAREIVHHLADSETASALRLRRLLAEEYPVIYGYDQEAYAILLRYNLREDMQPSLDAFRAARESTAPQTLTQSGSETQREATPAPIVGGLDEEFLRLDLELHMLLEPTVGGRQWQLRPYVRLLNALDQRDALFYTFQPWRSDVVRPLAERPLLPLVGVAISF